MSSRISVQHPYIIAALPRVKKAHYVVGEVIGASPGSKKRKRPELAVGIHGEGVNLYDIPSSKLLTSYAVPPGTTFTCPPCSLRSKTAKTKVERKTYVSSSGAEDEITLFRDSIEGSSATHSTKITHKIDSSNAPVAYLGSVASAGLGSTKKLDLLLVKKDGEIQCLDGEGLQLLWTSPASALGRASGMSMSNIEVEHSQLTTAFAASQRILRDRQDILAFFPQEVVEDGFNPDILIVITRSNIPEAKSVVRTLHIVSLPRKATTHMNGTIHSVEGLLDARLPIQTSKKKKSSLAKTSFGINVSAGTVQILEAEVLTTVELHNSSPTIQSTIKSPGTNSFLRLSSTSIMTSTQKSISILNPKFESVLATVELEDLNSQISLKRKRHLMEKQNPWLDVPCQFISYYPKLGTAVAISGNELVAIQVDIRPSQTGDSRAIGLLIDSIGCSDPYIVRSKPGKEPSHGKWLFVDHYLPGSMGITEPTWEEMTKEPEKNFEEGDATGFEKSLSDKFREKWDLEGAKSTTKTPVKTSEVDRRWILYALSKIFSWSKNPDGFYQLSIVFFPLNLFRWLLQTGNMTVVNIESALGPALRASSTNSLPAGALVDAIVEIDREMDLLTQLVYTNYLGANELLHAIRKLMDSLDMLGDSATTKQALLANGDDSHLENGDVDKEVEMLEVEAEEELQLAEFQLGVGSSVRGEALGIALSKLYTCPDHAIVEGLQTTFTSQETVYLIYLLRFELAKGRWTTRYLENDLSGSEDDAPPDNSIILISSLLNNCIDAIGAGGWLSGDARLVNGDQFESEELISSLRLEISAALEGIEEAVYLKGLTSEMIRYGDAVLKGLSHKETGKKGNTILTIPTAEKELAALPIGLKAERHISRLRIGAGGEIQKRTKRDVGRLKSKQVGKYTRERIIL